MRTFCLVKDGIAVNRANFPDEGLPEDWPDAASWVESETAQIGWRYENGGFIEPEPAPLGVPVPVSVTRRQLILGLAAMRIITDEEGLAAAQIGTVPAAIEGYFATLPDGEAYAARITWATMTEARRDHPLIAALAVTLGLSSEQIDDAFRAWAAV